MADQLITGTTLVEKESRSIGDAPIGAIIAWAKSLAGVPNLAEGWVECDGSVLVDALSSLNGQTIPDLNGGEFLRGFTASGATGGSATSSHIHNMRTGTNFTELVIADTGTGTTVWDLTGDPTPVETGATAPTNLPPYYNVVWIMRVR